MENLLNSWNVQEAGEPDYKLLKGRLNLPVWLLVRKQRPAEAEEGQEPQRSPPQDYLPDSELHGAGARRASSNLLQYFRAKEMNTCPVFNQKIVRNTPAEYEQTDWNSNPTLTQPDNPWLDWGDQALTLTAWKEKGRTLSGGKEHAVEPPELFIISRRQ